MPKHVLEDVIGLDESDSLHDHVEFYSPFLVLPGNGAYTPVVRGVFYLAPDVTHNEKTGAVSIWSDEWEAITGYSGQHGYSGPCMHPSEFLGGRMAGDVLDTPGVYVLVEPVDEDTLEGIDMWVLLKRKNGIS